jgi:hypothetical protein
MDETPNRQIGRSNLKRRGKGSFATMLRSKNISTSNPKAHTGIEEDED